MAQALPFFEEGQPQENRYLTFYLGADLYGLSIRNVAEIIGMQRITPYPEVPEYVRGVINLRGRVIPVIDLALKFHKKPMLYNEKTCIIVATMEEVSAGFIVDGVEEVTAILQEEILVPPDGKNILSKRYIDGIVKGDNGIKILLDCDKLLEEDEIEELKNID